MRKTSSCWEELHYTAFHKRKAMVGPGSCYFHWPTSVTILEGHIETLNPLGISPNETNHIIPFTLHTHEWKVPDYHEIEEHYVYTVTAIQTGMTTHEGKMMEPQHTITWTCMWSQHVDPTLPTRPRLPGCCWAPPHCTWWAPEQGRRNDQWCRETCVHKYVHKLWTMNYKYI